MSSTRPLELDHHLAERDEFRGNVAEAMYPKQPQRIAGKHQFQHALRLRRLLACQKVSLDASGLLELPRQ